MDLTRIDKAGTRRALLTAVSGSDSAGDDARPGGGPIPGRLRGGSILIVDDVTMTACLTQAMLAHHGLQANIAYCAADALEWLNEHRADVIICDISMPGMSGIELAREIRNRWSGARPRLIAYTAYPREHQRLALLDEGFDDFVAKPVRAEKLAEIVRKWIN